VTAQDENEDKAEEKEKRANDDNWNKGAGLKPCTTKQNNRN